MQHRVLIADDSPQTVEPLRAVLQSDGYEVDTAADGRAALEQLTQRAYSIFLTDLRMPGLDGMRLIEEVRSRQLAVAVVVMTGFGSIDQAVRAIREMRPGNRVFVYHSGGVSGIVGLAEVRSDPRDDPKNPKSAVVELEFIRRLEPPTTLAEIKSSRLFEDWALVRQGRLSTMPAPEPFVDWMRTRYSKVKF